MYNQPMFLVTDSISNKQLAELASKMFGHLVKAVVDIETKEVALDAELHADLEAYLLDHGSKQHALWGVNLHPNNYQTDNFIEYDSMINIRPNQNNLSRSVLNQSIRDQIRDIIISKVTI